MPKKNWYVHISGETFGPISEQGILVMLEQSRLHFSDFIWNEDLAKWHRISDLDTFAQLMPEYPKVHIPKDAAEQVEAPRELKPERKTRKAPPEPPAPKEAEPNKKKEWPHARRFIRIPTKGSIETQGHGGFVVLNVSEGGLFVRSDQPLEIGTEFKFTFLTDVFDKPLEMAGVVIRHGQCDGQQGFAIEFLRVNPAHKRLIHGYVQKNEND